MTEIERAARNSIPIDASTRVYAVLGNPIEHSMSPMLHNDGFAAVQYPGVLVAFKVTDIAAAIAGIRSLGLRGAAVTLPHKVTIMPHIDTIDPQAKSIGAVNTVINRDGHLTGYNSDCPGAMKALLEKTAVQGKRVAVIGAGGAARAVGFGVKAEKGDLTIYNRTRPRGEALAKELDARFLPLSEVEKIRCDILINTSSLGMHPDIESTPVPGKCLNPEMVVMDIVYNPLETLLLKSAREKGCAIVDGLTMFVYQAAFQFELWTGKPAPVGVMKKSVHSILSKKNQKR